MTMFQDVDAEVLARIFHHYQEALAVKPERPENKDVSWEHAPQQTRRLMIDAARLTLQELSTTEQPKTDREFFAKPGEAEWGC
jgi:hypothetical protein